MTTNDSASPSEIQEEYPRVRLIGKNAAGDAILELTNNANSHVRQTIPANEFESYFKPTDDPCIYEMILDDDAQAMVDAQIERVRFVIKNLPHVLRAKKNPDLINMSVLGSIMQEYFKEFPSYNPIDFVNDYNLALEMSGLRKYMPKEISNAVAGEPRLGSPSLLVGEN